MTEKQYRGRIAPSPTGLLHIGHAVTFWRAHERACAAGGKLVLRIEDLDRDRCRREFAGDTAVITARRKDYSGSDGRNAGGDALAVSRA